ncbi:MAG: pilus assembly protein [Hyphomicrobiaceae bacterium]
MSAVYHQFLKRFRRAEDGAIAIIFALTMSVLVMMAGLAIDIGRVMHASAKMSFALDAAVLSAAKSMREGGLSDEDVKQIAERYFKLNFAGSGVNYTVTGDLGVSINREANSIELSILGQVPTLFARIAGIDQFTVPRTATAIYESNDVELALQLDVTGSMAGRKLADLKLAVHDLLDIMLPDEGTTNKVRVGLAPFSAGVNAGSYAAAVTDGRATDGCVYERRNLADQASDAPAVGALSLRARNDLTGRSIQACPSDAKIVALTESKSTLWSAVNAYREGGTTAGHLGTAWAWYLLSPEWSSLWPSASRPAPYRDAKTIKAVVLMTDGSYNTIGGVSSGDTSATARQVSTIAVATCEAMRAQGIRVYAVGFQAPTEALETLRNCASSASSFFDAANGDQLRNVFRAIATELNNLRLSS